MSTITRKFQTKTLKLLESVPGDIRCPCCHHGFQIVVSRNQILGSVISRKLFRHYHCKVCDHRFREISMSRVVLLIATLAAVCSIPIVWLLLKVL